MKGFTLIETVISIVVIGVAFLGLVAVFTGAFTNATFDEAMTVATMLTKGEMERVIGLGFSVDDEHRDDPVSFGGNFTNYSWQVRVDPVPEDIAVDEDMSEYKQVEVRVTNAIVGDISLKTIITNY